MSERPTPIFILGILERSGTNFLWDLVSAHPDVGIREPIYEDNLLRSAHLLQRYVDEVASRWRDPRWNVSPDEPGALLRHLGSGIAEFITTRATTPYVVVKTPNVSNLEMFFDVFPDSPLVLLVRDGRNVTESGVRSFGWSYPLTMRQWADAGRAILDATQAFDAAGRRYVLVRYEDLVDDPRAELTRVFESCGLDPATYDFDAAAAQPVRGSSTDRVGDGDEVVFDKVVTRGEDFAGVRRFADWDDALVHLYAELAGDVSARLGYPLDPPPPMTGSVRMRVARYRSELAVLEQRRRARLWSGRVRYAAAQARRRR